ncbi:hypothetical protein FF100_04750 [Methylobacterium terricola]|uniref:NusG-like N-terminal domain-containing protein n=1 Tax=Methylobacterium terricola TaxID=2583531 RepID=A0A5C4LN67_9HYPH|nr:transcription termination/antitermination NusG family protein [Methylobacterium terricola]TNC14891.1 hypothetical protein FF100_04750 [Methylobacterium terricola]
MFAKNASGRAIKAQATPVHYGRLPTKVKIVEDKPLAEEDRMEAPEITPGAPRKLPKGALGTPAITRDAEGRRWYALTVMAQTERKCCLGLRKLGYAAYSPAETIWVPYSRQQQKAKREVQRPFFVRYVFIGMHDDDPWWPLRERDAFGRNKLGIVGIVSNQGKPMLMRVDELAKIANHEREGWYDERKRPLLEQGEKELSRPKVEAGEMVRIIDGAFATYEGRADEDSTAEKARVWINVFGRETLMVMPIADVENLSRRSGSGENRVRGPLIPQTDAVV